MTDNPVKVHINKRLVEVPEGTTTVEQLLLLTNYDPTKHEVRLLQGEGDASGGAPLEMSSSMKFENGQHFRVLPIDRNLG